MIESTGPVPTRRTLRRGVGVGLTAAVALTGLGLATGVASASSAPAGAARPAADQQAAGVRAPAAAAAASSVRACNGGAYKRMQSVGSNTPTTFTGSASLLPAPLLVAGPARGSDTLVLTWTGETQLRGNASHAEFDWIEGVITVDGVAVTDTGSSQLALSGSPYYGSNATQVCVRIGRGVHKIRMSAKVVNTSGQTETAWIDDWRLRADVLD